MHPQKISHFFSPNFFFTFLTFVARDRIELILDEDSPFLELCPLAGWGQVCSCEKKRRERREKFERRER